MVEAQRAGGLAEAAIQTLAAELQLRLTTYDLRLKQHERNRVGAIARVFGVNDFRDVYRGTDSAGGRRGEPPRTVAQMCIFNPAEHEFVRSEAALARSVAAAEAHRKELDRTFLDDAEFGLRPSVNAMLIPGTWAGEQYYAHYGPGDMPVVSLTGAADTDAARCTAIAQVPGAVAGHVYRRARDSSAHTRASDGSGINHGSGFFQQLVSASSPLGLGDGRAQDGDERIVFFADGGNVLYHLQGEDDALAGASVEGGEGEAQAGGRGGAAALADANANTDTASEASVSGASTARRAPLEEYPQRFAALYRYIASLNVVLRKTFVLQNPGQHFVLKVALNRRQLSRLLSGRSGGSGAGLGARDAERGTRALLLSGALSGEVSFVADVRNSKQEDVACLDAAVL